MPRNFRGYQVQKKIGSGGMSTLYLGIQETLQKKVAIKILHPGLGNDEQFIARFEREARAASAIGHRNIVYVTDFGSEDDVYYIVMEYVPGKDLKGILADVRPIPPEIVLALLEEVAYGLEAAHEQGVIHRDIKPSNILLSSNGEVKIADFGLARQSDEFERISALTVPGSVLGTPAYMSPEQAAGKEVDHRTDIYSLGVMAYELLTGDRPFPGSSYSEIRDQIINQEPAPLGERTAVTPSVEALVNRCLEKDPDRRPQSARQLLRSIEECMEELDPSGGLFKHRRKYLREFAGEPAEFAEELRRTSISSHLDRGFYFKQMGLSKISDAIREFRYVLFLDPENVRASSAVRELKKQAEESGVRLPPTSPPVSAGPDPGRSSSGTRVLSTDDVSAETLVGTEPAREAGTGSWMRAHRGRAIAVVGLVLLAVLLIRMWPRGAPAGELALESEPPGAAVFVRAPDRTDFEATGLRTDCLLQDLEQGIWEVRLDLDGHRPQMRRVRITSERDRLRLRLEPIQPEGRIEVTTEPEGATVAIRGTGEPDFRTLPGVTPLRSEPIAAGSWEVRVGADGEDPVIRTVEVEAGGIATLFAELEKRPEPADDPVETRSPETSRDRAAAERATGFVRLRVSPPADIYVDGKRVARNRGEIVVPIDAGEPHSVELRHATLGRKRLTDLRAAPGDTLDLGTHEFPEVEVRVFCRPPVAADVWIDGVRQERQTTFIGTVGAGRRRVRIEKAGYVVRGAVATSGGEATQLTPGPNGEVEILAQEDRELWLQFLVEKGE